MEVVEGDLKVEVKVEVVMVARVGRAGPMRSPLPANPAAPWPGPPVDGGPV